MYGVVKYNTIHFIPCDLIFLLWPLLYGLVCSDGVIIHGHWHLIHSLSVWTPTQNVKDIQYSNHTVEDFFVTKLFSYRWFLVSMCHCQYVTDWLTCSEYPEAEVRSWIYRFGSSKRAGTESSQNGAKILVHQKEATNRSTAARKRQPMGAQLPVSWEWELPKCQRNTPMLNKH